MTREALGNTKRTVPLKLILTVAAIGAVALALAIGALISGATPAASESEIWVTSQGTDRLFIAKGAKGEGGIETVSLPAGTGPHLVTFSQNGKYAYISGMGNGSLEVMRADSRTIAASLSFGAPAGTHQAKPSPDGAVLLVTQIPTRKLVSLAVDEASESWSQAGELVLTRSPICTIFRDDGQRAYVSLLPDGIAVVDVATMTLVKTLPTDGFVACGMVKSHNGKSLTLAASGRGGHVYRLNLVTDELDEDLGPIGARDWHSFTMGPNEKVGFGSVPAGDELKILNLEGRIVTTLASFRLDPTSGEANDQPDNMAIQGNTLYVTLRASGKLAIVDVQQRKARFLDLSAPADLNPMTCAGCAIHGVSIRP